MLVGVLLVLSAAARRFRRLRFTWRQRRQIFFSRHFSSFLFQKVIFLLQIYFLLQDFLFLRLLFRFTSKLFISFLSGIFPYEFIVFSRSFFFLSLFASESETERQKKDFDEWNSFPFHYFSPARAELVSFPERKPLPITDRRIYFPLTCCCSGQTTNEHAFTFSFRKKNVALFFSFLDSRKKKGWCATRTSHGMASLS